MRNLKRALSMAMASVMLMGMSVVGTSAASVSDFSDVDSINNKEAVAIATGLGIFDGYDDGSFKPEKVVTRAEMAVVIAKILHGADVNPSNLTGAGKFTDVPAWAEGYVNLCDSLGIIKGYGDGKFGPNDPVTTVQANIMLLKALGYYTAEGDNLSSNWADAQLAATSKAAALGITGDLELPMAAGLTREDVAELTFNALFAQRVAYDDVRGLHVKSNDRNVVVTNGTVDQYNTLAQNTFGLYKTEGVVVANSMTDMNLVGDSNVGNQTKVMFDEATDVNLDGRTDGTEYVFEYETGLDMIGHAAKVYYKIEKKAPVVYAAVDQATLATEVVLTDNLSTLAKANGFSKDTSETEFGYNYSLDLVNEVPTLTFDPTNYAAKKGQMVKLISNSSDLTVDYAIVVESTLDYVDEILVDNADKDDPIYRVELNTNPIIRDDMNMVVVGEVSEKDYVLVTKMNNRDNNGTGILYILETADSDLDTLVKVTRKLGTTTKLASEAVEYKKSDLAIETNLVGDYSADDEEDVIPYKDVLMKGDYRMIYDPAGRVIGVVPADPDKTVNTAYIAQFGTKINTDPALIDTHVLTAHIYFADGTNGYYVVDSSNFTDNAFWGSASATDFTFKDTANLSVTAIGAKNVTKNYEKNQTNDALTTNANLNDTNANGYGDFIRLYDVEITENGKARIKELPNQNLKAVGATDRYDLDNAGTNGAVASKLNTVNKGVTYMGVEAGATANEKYFAHADTTIFFVDGVYDNDLTNKGITVGVKSGMAEVPTLDLTAALQADGTFNGGNGDANDDGIISQANASQKKGYKSIDNALISGHKLISTIKDVYYYDGEYQVIDTKDGKFDLMFYVYDLKTGEAKTITYMDHYTTDASARGAAASLENGFYTPGTSESHNLVKYLDSSTNAIVDPNLADWGANQYTGTPKVDTAGQKYVVDAKFLEFFEQGDVLTMYTSANNDGAGVTVNDKTLLVDLVNTDNNLSGLAIDKLGDLDKMIKARVAVWAANNNTLYTKVPSSATDTGLNSATATLVYDYDKNNQVGVIYVVDMVPEYNKDYTGNLTPPTAYAATLINDSGALKLYIGDSLGNDYNNTLDYVVTMTNTNTGVSYEQAEVNVTPAHDFSTNLTILASTNSSMMYSIEVTLADGSVIKAGPVIGG